MFAQPSAEQLAKQARAHAAAGDYQKAVDGYKKAYAKRPKASYRCNIGVAYYRLAKWPRAHFALAECISNTASLPAKVVAKVGQAYAYVEKTLKAGDYAKVRVRTTAADAKVKPSFLDADDSYEAGRWVWAPFGSHTVRVTAPGHVEASMPLVVRTRGEMDLDVPMKAEPKPAPKPAPPPPAVTKPVPKPLPPPAEPRIRPERKPAWIAFGVGALALAGGAVFHVKALGTKSDAKELEPGSAFDDKLSDFEGERNLAIGLYGVAVIGAGVGAYLWHRSSKKARVRMGATAGPRSAGAWARWNF